MARPRKFRKVCHFPKTLRFVPKGEYISEDPILLTLEEYETIRLIDKEGRSQEECSVSMKVARTTVQSIYTGARKKIADALVDGRPLEIAGGDYDLCNGRMEYCSRKDCFKKELHCRYEKKNKEYFRVVIPMKKEEKTEILGEADGFLLVDYLDKKKAGEEWIDIRKKGRASIVDFLHIIETDAILCSRMEENVRQALEEVNILCHSGDIGKIKG